MEPYEEIFFYVVGITGGVVGVVGLLMTSLGLMVLGQKSMMASNSSLYLIALGVYDLIYLLLNLLITSLDWVVYGVDNYSDFGLLFTVPASVVADPIIAVSISGSVYTTVALTIDRSIAVVNPLNWSSICTRHRVKVVLGLVFLWAVLSSAPLFAEFRLHEKFLRQLNQTYVLPVKTSYATSGFHRDFYVQYFIPFTTFLIPSLAIFVPNVLILVSLKRVRENNMACAQNKSKPSSSSSSSSSGSKKPDSSSYSSSSSSSSSPSSQRLTAQVLFISLFTLVSRLLHGASYLALKLEDAYYVSDCSLPCATLAAVNALVLTLAPALNVLCYCVFGGRFRRALVTMLSSCSCFRLRRLGGAAGANRAGVGGLPRASTTPFTVSTAVSASSQSNN